MFNFPVNIEEIFAVITGVLSVFFSYRKSILTFPMGMISCLLYIYICFSSGIYADSGINAFYFLMSIYGWFNWGKSMEFKVQKLKIKEHYYMILFTILIFLILFFLLLKFSDSDVIIVDAITTSLCISGMLLMAWRNIENWIYLLIANVISIPLYLYKELYFSSLLFIILSIFAVLGFLNWKKHLIH